MSLPPITQIPSPNRNTGRTRKVRVVVIHTMESPENATTAEDVARNWFARTAARASAHYCVDADSIVQCVSEADTAWAAPGANADGIQIELAGRAGQGATGWADTYSAAELDIAARLVADICTRHSIPIRKLTREQLAAGERGIIGHADASAVYRLSDHTDPGPDFPWDQVIAKARSYAAPTPVAAIKNGAKAAASAIKLAKGTPFPLAPGHWYGVDDRTPRSHSGARVADRAQVKRIQAKVGATADGRIGPRTAAAIAQWQRKSKLTADSKVGKITWTKMGL